MTDQRPSDDTYVVTIARHGTRTALRSEIFLNYPLYRKPDAPIRMDYFVWVVRNAARTVVIDTGYSLQGAAARGRTVLVEVPTLFDLLGVDPTTAPLVVITHAHYDHIGNLDHFPESRMIVSRREHEFWNGPYGGRPLFRHSVEDVELAYLNQLVESGRVELFEGAAQIAPGIDLLEVGGHTPGQSVLIVNTSQGKVLIASDAVHYYEELTDDMPFSSVTDVVGMYEAFARIREMVSSGKVAHLVSGHDPSTLERFRPASGALAGIAATIGGDGEDQP